MPSPTWYLRRLSRMSPSEVLDRTRHQAVKLAWRRRQVKPGRPDPLVVPAEVPAFAALLPTDLALQPDPAAVADLVDVAELLLKGHTTILGVDRLDFDAPDWFLDPTTGVRAPQHTYCFSIDHRSPAEVGVIKNVWEPSRHHQLTVLAAAYRCTGDERYAERVSLLLNGWWQANPFLSGVHWTSGIELGIRLISWAWVRRLLDGWAGAPELFERNPLALRQLHHHQEYLSRLLSTGSSANNHLIAEAAGLAVAGLAFPWFAPSPRWASRGLEVIVAELERQTDGDGLNRELASEYHGLVLELGLAVAAELQLTGHPVPPALAGVLVRMFDALAAEVDEHLEPPRQGDGDGGFGWLFDGPQRNRWAGLLVLGDAVAGALPWWPDRPAPAVGESLVATALTTGLPAVSPRPERRPTFFGESGMTILRGRAGTREVWCRLDAGPLGFLSIAAHGHADALSLELRVDGTDVLADPGTYCYTGDEAARSYFRSTIGHNTVELGGVDQSVSGGPFMWTRHARADLVAFADDGDLAVWTAEHDGYRRLAVPAIHRRTVRFERSAARLEVLDEIDLAAAVGVSDTSSGPSSGDAPDGVLPARLAWHLGPLVDVELDGAVAHCTWPGGSAVLHLPDELTWQAVKGQLDPVLGWYSPSFGVRVPATTLVGSGEAGHATTWRTAITITR